MDSNLSIEFESNRSCLHLLDSEHKEGKYSVAMQMKSDATIFWNERTSITRKSKFESSSRSSFESSARGTEGKAFLYRAHKLLEIFVRCQVFWD